MPRGKTNLISDKSMVNLRLRRLALVLLLACTTAGLAASSYYPERSITYMTPGVAILLAMVVLRVM